LNDIIENYLLGKITFDDVYEEFNKLIYQIVKREVEKYGIN
jgi:hypothetical protein